MPCPVVLLHAFPLSSRMWQPLADALGPSLQLVTPDFRGAGEVPLGDGPPSLDVLADDVAALLDSRGVQRAVVGGLSMGGYVALAFARRHPERLAALVLADTRTGADTEAARQSRLEMAETLVREGTPRVLVEESLPGLLGDTTKRSRPDVVAFVRELVSSASPATAAWWQRAMAARADSHAVLDSLDVPVLVLVGAEDTLTPPAGASAMAEAARLARLVVLPGAGHLSAIETPAEFAAELAAFVGPLS